MMTEEKNASSAGNDQLPVLSEDNRKYLKDIAREAVEGYVNGQPGVDIKYDDAVLKEQWGAFVTLRIHGELRGCIGFTAPHLPLPETIVELAVKSASSDFRFSPIGPADLEHLGIEISILGKLTEVKDINEIVIGRHGLIIELGGRPGLLLPQVATEHGLDVIGFLEQTCLKAGLQTDAWQHGARILKFPALVF